MVPRSLADLDKPAEIRHFHASLLVDAAWTGCLECPSFRAKPRWRAAVGLNVVNVMGGKDVNKNDLVATVADTSGLSRQDATKAVDAVFEAITQSLKSGTEVRLVGFGTFTVSKRAATTGRNPRTGEEIQIPASTQPKFKAGKGLKDALN
jgi:DNA-binding protein HU-beta